ncbi:MAG TPA: hypothetical protein VK100_05045 [Pseudogracilibacillus sp.]|nr:hypothetical protein [Pseudogracilibacillus sp.]
MKKIILTIASILLVAGGAVGFTMKATADNTSASETKVKNEQHETQTEEKDTNDFHEYDALKKVVDLNEFTIEEVEDNQNKHVIILKDDQDMPQFKSIYVKNKDRLKVVDFDKGVIFNQALSDTENDTNDNKSESNDNNTVEKDKEGSKEQKQKSEIEEFTEYSILDKKLDMDNLSDEVVKDNDYKRIILLKDENGQPQYKSIYIKNKNRLKVIDLHGGLVYNDKI